MLLFNRYEYNPQSDLLGKGGFSRVYKALDKKLNRQVALKIYKTGDVSERYSLGSEIQRVINLDHPNVSRYLDIDDIENENAFGEVEKIQVCVMELLDGGNILNYYRAHPDETLLIRLLVNVLNGLAYLHENDIIHRDIKPGNILIKNTKAGPVAKITDFGISKIAGTISAADSSSALIVSIPYMAPEQLNAKKFGINGKVSFNIDLWSLGVAVYEIVTGDVLFKNNPEDSAEQVMLNIMAPGIPAKIETLPEPFRSFVAKCVIKDARERPEDVGGLIALLESKPAMNEKKVYRDGRDLPNAQGAAGIPAPDSKVLKDEDPAVGMQMLRPGPTSINEDDAGEDRQALLNDQDAAAEPVLGTEATAADSDETRIRELSQVSVKEDQDDTATPVFGTNAAAEENDAAQMLQSLPSSIKENQEDHDATRVTAFDEQAPTEDNDATQILQSLPPSIKESLEEPTDTTAPAFDFKAVAEDTDATQILPLLPGSIKENQGDEDATGVFAFDAKAGAEDDDATQILESLPASVKENQEGDDATTVPAFDSKATAEDDDATQVLQSLPSSIKENQEDQADQDATAVLAVGPKPIEEDNEATQLLKPGGSGKPFAAGDNEAGKANSFQTGTHGQEEPENKILLFKRYEYYPNKNLIGKGGFSRVYKAFDKKLQRWVALKIYKTGNFSDRYSPIAEIQRVVNLDHSNICRYLDIEEIEKVNPFGEKETIQICVMELLDSGNLLQYFEENPDPKIFAKLLRDVFMGLSYLHKNGIIHRDIKPANILIKQTIDGPIAKITDFGISKKSDAINNNSSSALVVSIPYMAPEQLNVKKYGIDGRISFNLDLWSLGVTIYEVLTGKVLFKNSEADNSEQIMTNIMAAELPDKIRDLEAPFAEIVARCIVKKASDRAQRVEELLAILQRNANTGILQSVIATHQATPAPKAVVNTEKPAEQPVAPEPIAEKTSSKGSRSGFYVLEDDVKAIKPTSTFRKRYLVPGLILVLLLAATTAAFFIKRNSSQPVNVLPAKENHDVLADTVATVPPPLATDSLSKGAPVNDSIKKAVPATAINGSKGTDNIVEKKKKKEEPVPVKNSAKREKIGADTYLLELKASLDCIVKINSFNYGEIKAHGKMKVWLSIGSYQIKVTSMADNTEIYSRSIDVGAGQLGSVGHLQIK